MMKKVLMFVSKFAMTELLFLTIIRIWNYIEFGTPGTLDVSDVFIWCPILVLAMMASAMMVNAVAKRIKIERRIKPNLIVRNGNIEGH